MGFRHLFPIVWHRQVQPTVVNFACAISACRDWRRALQLLEALESSQAAPDAAIFNALMSAAGCGFPRGSPR